MKATVEPVEGNKVKLSIQVDSAEFEPQVDAAFKRIAREVRIPGFRPGKAPRKLLEARIGVEAARGDALEHALPQYYADAVEEHDIDVIAAPEIDLATATLDQLISAANDHYARGQDRLRAGDWAGYGTEMDALKAVLNQLATLTGSGE